MHTTHAWTYTRTHARTNALIHWYTYSLTHPPKFAHSPTQPPSQPASHSLTHSTTQNPLTHSLTHLRIPSLTHPLTHSRVHSLTHPLINASTHSLTHPLTQPLITIIIVVVGGSVLVWTVKLFTFRGILSTVRVSYETFEYMGIHIGTHFLVSRLPPARLPVCPSDCVSYPRQLSPLRGKLMLHLSCFNAWMFSTLRSSFINQTSKLVDI